ncbi:hypothetical protein [Leptolyngbya sp. PCC 6406]|uniref:hypothetical protein n=1 Tax=Leptolyngbya sp. PCC 6406 TaxID=1173264 RepID=UPI0002ABE23D|nr:hypothetical protein [Leptolyngbya sp. PCC 6406]
MAGINELYGDRRWQWGILMAVVGAIAPTAAVAQTFPPCPPPAPTEYLLLIQGNTEVERNRIQSLLPTSTNVMVCQYLSEPVVRAGGFSSLENANAWAQYLTEVEGAQAFVARPASDGTAAPLPSDLDADSGSSSPSTAGGGYAPQLLGEGYAVLVDYGTDPAIASAIQSTLGKPVGLAVYRQRPYLLAIYSGDVQTAAATLQQLSGRVTAFMVDSSEVVLLAPTVAVSNE